MQKHNLWLLSVVMTIVALMSGALTTRVVAAGYGYDNNRNNNSNNNYSNDNFRVAMSIPQGTVIPVSLDQTLSSATNHKGDTFTVSVRSQYDGDNELPLGTKIVGVITDVQRKTSNQPGMLDVDFRQIVLANGQKTKIQGSLVSLDAKSVNQTSDGSLIARDTTSKDRLKFIAIGGGAGLIIGKLTKHTLLGGVLGVVAGYFYSQQMAGRPAEVTVKAGTVFGVQLDKALSYTTNRAFANARDNYRKGPHYNNYPGQNQVITVTINGRGVNLGNTPAYEESGNVFIPLTPVMNAVRVPFTYDERNQTLVVNTDRGELYMKIGRSYALMQGEKESLEASAVVRNGEVFVTPNYLALATDMGVFWDVNARAVTMTYSALPYLVPINGQDISVAVKGQNVLLRNNRPFLVGKEILIPLAPVMDAANVPYSYNERRQSIRVETDGGVLYLNIDSNSALLDGVQVNLETPAQVVNGQIYVPLHFLSLATGLTARWNTRQQTVTLN